MYMQDCGDTQDDGGGISIHNIGGVFIVIFVGRYLGNYNNDPSS